MPLCLAHEHPESSPKNETFQDPLVSRPLVASIAVLMFLCFLWYLSSSLAVPLMPEAVCTPCRLKFVA